MTKIQVVIAFCLLYIGVKALKLPSYIKPCSRHDPKFNECALKSGREAIPTIIKGDPKYGVPVLDPLLVDHLSMTISGLTTSSTNFTIKGVKDAIIEDISVDFEKQIIRVAFSAPRTVLTGEYGISGKLAGLPISGNGYYELIFEDLRGNYTTNYTLTTLKDGKMYAIPQTYSVDFAMNNLHVQFDNLFNGNKVLGDTMNNFINENWRLVVEEIGKPTFTTVGSIVHKILSNVATKIPYNELFLD